MSKYHTFKDLWSDLESQDSFWTEKAIIDFTAELQSLMEHRSLTKKDFAEKIGKSQAYITKVFRGNANFTIGTMVKLSRALDGEFTMHITPKEEKATTWYRAIGKKVVAPHLKWGHPLGDNVVADGIATDYSNNLGMVAS